MLSYYFCSNALGACGNGSAEPIGDPKLLYPSVIYEYVMWYSPFSFTDFMINTAYDACINSIVLILFNVKAFLWTLLWKHVHLYQSGPRNREHRPWNSFVIQALELLYVFDFFGFNCNQ